MEDGSVLPNVVPLEKKKIIGFSKTVNGQWWNQRIFSSRVFTIGQLF
jgi:hypothetical protein